MSSPVRVVKRRSRLVHLVLAGAGFGLFGSACSEPEPPPRQPPAQPAALAIAAASDLRYALDELVEAFRQRNPGTGVAVSYGSSGSFYAQLMNDAPFDLFLSADIAYARQLVEKGVGVPESEFKYAEGHIVLWVPASSKLDIGTRGLRALTDPSVTRVAIANPEIAPYGRAAEAALRSSGVYDAVKPKLVLGDNVSQALQFAQSGAAQAGIVALSLALAPPVVSGGRYWAVPGSAHPPIEQGGVIMRKAARPDAARAFRSFLLSPDARVVLARYGFVLPET